MEEKCRFYKIYREDKKITLYVDDGIISRVIWSLSKREITKNVENAIMNAYHLGQQSVSLMYTPVKLHNNQFEDRT